MSDIDRIIKILSTHYDELAREHGPNPESGQWSDLTTQQKRFSILCEISKDISTSSILDIGCGTGALYGFLKEYYDFKSDYLGIDISQEAINVAKRTWPEATFKILNIMESNIDEEFDFVIISGIFNNRIGDDETCTEYMKSVLNEAFKYSKKGLSFNLLSKYVDYEDNNLCYFQPEDVFKFCKTSLSNFVTLRHDYQIKEGIIPFEFTIYVYK